MDLNLHLPMFYLEIDVGIMRTSLCKGTIVAEIFILIIIVLTSPSYSVHEVVLDCGENPGGLVTFTYYGDVFQVYMEGEKEITCFSVDKGVTPYFIIYDLNGTQCGMQRMGKLNVWTAKIHVQVEAVITDQDKIYMAICSYDKVIMERMQPMQVNEISSDWNPTPADIQEKYDVALSVIGSDGVEINSFRSEARMHLVATLFIVNAPCSPVNIGLENVCKLADAWSEFDSLCYDLRRPPFSICNEAVDPERYVQSCKQSFCSCTAEVQTCVCNTYESYACACKEKGVILDWHPYARCPYSLMLVSTCSLIDEPDQPSVDHPVIFQGCGDGSILSVHDKFLPTSQHVIETTDFTLDSLPKFDNFFFRCDVTICRTYTQCYMMCPTGPSESQLLNGTVLHKLTVFSQHVTKVDSSVTQTTTVTAAINPTVDVGNVRESKSGLSVTSSNTQLLIITGSLLFLLVVFIIITLLLLRMILKDRQRNDSMRTQAATMVVQMQNGGMDHFRPEAKSPSPSMVDVANGDGPLSPEVVKTFNISRAHSKPRILFHQNVARRPHDSLPFVEDRYRSES